VWERVARSYRGARAARGLSKAGGMKTRKRKATSRGAAATTGGKAKATPRSDARVRPIVHVLTDSTGNLAKHMLAAFLTQFPADAIDVRFQTFIRSQAKLKAALAGIEAARGIVCHAMVSQELKREVASFSEKMGLPCCDLTGGVFEFLVRATGLEPGSDPEALHRVDHAYKQRIGALEFTLNHDDGLGLASIGEADVILAGVSRTSKTPTSIYLAQQGYRVANVSLAAGVEPPQQLLQMPRGKVVGLVIDSQQLVLIRSHRQSGWRMAGTSYDDPEAVAREMEWARRLFVSKGWPVLDVTDQAVEETAAHVVRLLDLEPATAATRGPAEFS